MELLNIFTDLKQTLTSNENSTIPYKHLSTGFLELLIRNQISLLNNSFTPFVSVTHEAALTSFGVNMDSLSLKVTINIPSFDRQREGQTECVFKLKAKNVSILK